MLYGFKIYNNLQKHTHDKFNLYMCNHGFTWMCPFYVHHISPWTTVIALFDVKFTFCWTIDDVYIVTQGIHWFPWVAIIIWRHTAVDLSTNLQVRLFLTKSLCHRLSGRMSRTWMLDDSSTASCCHIMGSGSPIRQRCRWRTKRIRNMSKR